MKVFRSVYEVREHRRGRQSVGLVPTMGAFHEGHLELMRQAREQCEAVYVSLFVNPTQFSPTDDLSAYPRNEERDLILAKEQGVDAVFAPAIDEIYTGQEKRILVDDVSENWEGEHRPGHFDAVATVVYRLFDIFNPDKAFFGLKDLQQCAVIKKMVSDQSLPIEVITVETIREKTGLALSSRNAYLSDEERLHAANLYKCLMRAVSNITMHQISFKKATEMAKTNLESFGFEVEYVAYVNSETMKKATEQNDFNRVICAVQYRGVRLIDNVLCR